MTQYLSNGKIHRAIKNKLFKFLGYINHQLNEVEFIKAETEYKEPISVGFLCPAVCKLRMLEL